jgi:lipopolysaccharide export system protein LptA
MADSMVYNRNTGFGEAFENIQLIDSVEEMTIVGRYGAYWRKEKRTLITGQPHAMKNMDGDTFYLRSDTMIDQRDSNDIRRLQAFHNVQIYKSDLQAKSDSMLYDLSDSTITLYEQPVVWSDSNQITGDTIVIFRNASGIDRMEAFANGFMIERDPNGFFNQIRGKTIITYFDSSKLDYILVEGNAQNLYYVLEDSVNYSGVKDMICGRMTIHTDSNHKISTIHYGGSPKSVFYPLDDLPAEKAKLQGFNWMGDLRPRRMDFSIK